MRKLDGKSDGGRSRRVVTAVALVALVTTSCNSGPARVKPPSIDAGDAASQAMELYDADGDGLLAGAELDKAPGLKAAIATLDTDKDGKVSADEIEERIRTWQSTRIGVASVQCLLLMDGKPLTDANITFEPESFLGEAVLAGDGTSDMTGAVYPRIPKEKRPTADTPGGLQLGFYRLRVSKPVGGKETIPGKYNKETTLGQQVAPDDPAFVKQKIIVNVTSR